MDDATFKRLVGAWFDDAEPRIGSVEDAVAETGNEAPCDARPNADAVLALARG